MQVDDVGLLEFRQADDVGAAIGDVHGKQVLLVETIVFPDYKPLPQEMPLLPPRGGQHGCGDAVGLLVAYQHFGLHPVVVQGFGQSAGRHGCSAYALGCIDNEDSHDGNLLLFGCEDRKNYATSQYLFTVFC